MKDVRHSDPEAVSWPLPGRPRLLTLQPTQEPTNVRLPQIPRPAWEEHGVPARPPHASTPTASLPFMSSHRPFLRTYRPEDVPERDSSTLPRQHVGRRQPVAAPGGVPFPLLRLENSDDHHTMSAPRLIPPEDVLRYEQLRYGQQARRGQEARDFVREQLMHQMASLVTPPPRPDITQDTLLQPETFEPFGSMDERDSTQRMRHRLKKAKETRTKPKRKPTVAQQKSQKPDHGVRREADSEDAESTLTGATEADTLQDAVPLETASPTATSPVKSTASQPPKHDQRSQDTQQADEEVMRAHLNHGFALTPGLFDEYLKVQGDLGALVDSNARIQYNAAMALRDPPKREVSKRDVGTFTSSVDRGTSVTVDTGTDPVTDAIQKYYRAKTGHTSTILPPDVYLGLRYDDPSGTQPTGPQTDSGGRAFLNVVDIGAELLDEILESREGRGDKSSPPRSRVKLPSERAKQREREERLADVDALIDAQDFPGVEDHRRSDHLTADLLGRPPRSVRDRVDAEDAILSQRRLKSKDSIRQKLDTMDSQFNALEAMGSAMEQDFKTSNLLLHTIEHMGEALSADRSPDKTRGISGVESGSPDDLDPQRTPREQDDPGSDIFDNYPGLLPSKIKQVRQERGDRTRTSAERSKVMFEDELPTDVSPRKDETEDLEVLDAMEMQDRDDTMETDAPGDSSQPLRLSGLSGVSDIVGEMLAKGEMDAQEMGLTQGEADRLARKAVESSLERARLSHEELENIFRKTEKKERRSETERRQLRAWMDTKRSERHQAFKERQNELREAEKKPYEAATGTGNLMSSAALKLHQEREQTRRRDLEEANAQRRREMAAELMGDILSERPPTIKELPPRERSPSGREPSGTVTKKVPGVKGREMTTPRRTPVKKAPIGRIVSARSDRGGAARSRTVPSAEVKRSASLERLIRDNNDDLWNTGRRHGDHIATADGRLIDSKTKVIVPRRFAEAVDDEDDLTAHDAQATQRRSQPATAATAAPSPRRLSKQKSLSDLVRLQRPEVTRRRDKVKPKTYTERLSELQAEGSTARSTGTQRPYGTKRSPAGSPKTRASSARQVKTYTERLQDMKQSRPVSYHHPVSARTPAQQGPGVGARRPGMTAKKAGKPKTYAQQLQELQPPKDTYRGTETVTLHRDSSPPRRSHKAPHKPQTYVEQLRALQQPATSSVRTSTEYGPTGAKRYRTAPVRSLVRSRPYSDPYAEGPGVDAAGMTEEDDRLSMVSPWSMEDDVRHILYNGSEATLSQQQHRPSSQAATELDLAELSDLDYFVGDPEYEASVDPDYMMDQDPGYAAMVDPDELAEIGSLSEGSIMSFIDWDQVDLLIQDAK